MVRRAVAVGVGVLILILLVLGVRGCLNARQERAYENYVSDLSSIAAETQNLSQQFFSRLEDPGDLSSLQFEAEIQADRGAAEGLLDRSEGLDVPDDLSGAQELIVLSYELRRDGLAVISDRIAAAFGDEGSGQAISQIAREMRTFVASDVLYARAVAQIQAVLREEEIAIPESEPIATQFLPIEPNWLDPEEVSDSLGGIAGGGGAATGGVRGLGLGAVTLLPTGASITDGASATAAADGAELEVEVENQGESDESDVTVSYELTDGESSSGEESIDSIAAGEVGAVTLPIEPTPSPGTVELTVTAEPVEGEEIEENNTYTASVTFE